MAVKKTATKKEGQATPAGAEAKETAPKKAAKKAAAPKAATPEPAAAPAPAPTPTPVAEASTKAAPKKAAAKKAAAPLKLSASQDELLKKIGEAADAGYSLEKKAEQRSIDSLLEKKLIKKGAKDKTSGAVRYQISSAGKKHIS